MTAAINKPEKQATPATARALEVAVVTHYFPAHGGGIELVAERLIREMAYDVSFHFTWIASDCDAAPQIAGQTTLPMRCCNALEKLLGIPWPVWGWRSLKQLKQTIEKADIVWLHDTLYFGNIAAFYFARKAKKLIMVTQHIAPIPYKNPILRALMRHADSLFTSNMLKHAHEVTFISDRVADDYYNRVPFTRPITIIPNGVDVRVFHPAIAENRRFLRQQFALRNDQPVMLFVGRFVEKKGVEVIRRLAELLPDWRFWMAGFGPTDPDKWLLPNVHVLRNRKGQSLAELYQAADLLLIPSYGEGFPLVIQEAMACGLPILCGPSTAQGCAAAIPYLYVADVFPDNPERTAAVWFEKLKKFPTRLPLPRPQEALAEFAQTCWDWPPIARVYANILIKLAGTKP